jgi:hypothetical protein
MLEAGMDRTRKLFAAASRLRTLCGQSVYQVRAEMPKILILLVGAQGLEPWTRLRVSWLILHFAPPRKSVRSTRWRTRLFQRVRAGEGVDLRERISNPGEIRKRCRVDQEEPCSRRLARKANVGERDRVAVAIATGGGVFQVLFERGERGRVPVLAPFDAGRLIELEFVFQIFANARHDQRV